MKLFAVLCLLALPAAAAPPRLDPERVVGPQACEKCHDLEHRKWKGTAHARLYESEAPLHLRPRAQQIAKSLGKALIKNDPLCMGCHFTPRPLSGRVTAQAGVSCEHCHGAARDWINVHNTSEGRQVDRASETPEQRRLRQERNARAGMRGPGNLYDLLSSCYGCHLVPEERLVDAGGHGNGGEFDLPERFEKVRHNFVRGRRKDNAATTPERNRQLFVLGLALELEHSLRALAEAREEGGDYASALAERAAEAQRRLLQATRQAPLPRLKTALSSVEGLRLGAGNAELGAATRKLADAARAFAEQDDGSQLAALDSLLQEEEEEPPPEEAEGEEEAVEEEAPAPEANTGTAVSPAASGSPGRPAATGRPRTAGAQGPAGALKAHLRNPFPKGTVKGPGNCQKSCHAEQNDRWRREKHFGTADPFLRGGEAVLKIAARYYGRPAGDLIAEGKAVCLDCHATVKSGRIAAGVSCESCHGPAGAFFEPHKNAPSRAARLQAGIVDLEDPARRAEVCSSCHYITDPRLLASGHPRAKPFDLAARSHQIRHWKGGPDGGALSSVYQSVIAKRGVVPQVQVVQDVPAGIPAGGSGAGASAPGPAAGAARQAGRSAGPPRDWPPAPRPFVAPGDAADAPDASGPRRAAPIELPPLPEGAGKLPVAELLKLIERRLQLLAAATGGGGG